MARTPGCERLSSLDAMFLHIEDASAHMHVGGVFVCEGRPPSQGELLAHLASRLDRVPRYRQRLSFVPFGLGRPAWVDDGGFELSHHVRRVATAAPGVEALEVAAARIFSESLDLRRPLWGIDLLEGVGVDRFALVSRTHHCLVDGIGGCDIVSAITDDVPELAGSSPVASWAPRPEPPPAARLAHALRDQVARPLELLLGLSRPASEGRRMLHDLVQGLVPLAALGLQGRAPTSSLNAPIGPGRRYTMASIDLAAVKRVRALAGGTINDVLLSVVAGALRTLLHRRGVSQLAPLLAFVPVNERPPGALSYAGSIGVGLLGDAEEAGDLPLLARSVEDAFEALAVQTGAAPGASGSAVRPVRDTRGPATTRNRTAGSSTLPPTNHGRAAARHRPRGGAPPLASGRDVRRRHPGRHLR